MQWTCCPNPLWNSLYIYHFQKKKMNMLIYKNTLNTDYPNGIILMTDSHGSNWLRQSFSQLTNIQNNLDVKAFN